MATIQSELQQHVDAALNAALGEEIVAVVPREALQVVPCANPQFGDYQFNGAMQFAKPAKKPPRAIAEALLAHLDLSGMAAAPVIAGPGFINIRLLPEYVGAMAAAALADARLGVPATAAPRSIVVDFSSPNTAKPMHIGHIRSTCIGDAITRLLRFAGHDVVTDNHIGDWGTQFGMVIYGWKHHLDEASLQRDALGEVERLYKLVNKEAAEDATVAEAARLEIAKLQAGDAENRALWRKLREVTQPHFDEIYARLGVTFDVTLGESFYDAMLGDVVRELKASGVARDSEGAVIVPFEAPPQLVDKPMLIQKSDGSALYGTSDLATIRYRMERWHPAEMIYVVDARQSLHFMQVFAAARLWGYGDVALNHVAFGAILGEDNKPLKARSGEAVKLKDVLDEAEERALQIVREKNPDLDAARQREIARVIGIGAVKYADLSPNRTSDYVFSWERMLSMQGNTAPYLQYAYVRICSIFRKAETMGAVAATEMKLQDPAELELAKYLLQFSLAIDTALSDYRLNALTDYLFELAQKFNVFFENCPVLKSESPTLESRLALCQYTARVLKQGLNLLGIETIEQM